MWWSGAALLHRDLDDMIEPWILKENIQQSVHALKLRLCQVMQQNYDLKHTSESTSEWLNKEIKWRLLKNIFNTQI